MIAPLRVLTSSIFSFYPHFSVNLIQFLNYGNDCTTRRQQTVTEQPLK